MYNHMWSTITKDWVTLPNNPEKVFMQSLNQHGQGLIKMRQKTRFNHRYFFIETLTETI